MVNLEVKVVIYVNPSLLTSDCHVALVVKEDDYRCYLYHAVEAPSETRLYLSLCQEALASDRHIT